MRTKWTEYPLLVMLYIYCPITNCYKYSDFKQHTCIIAQFLWISGVWVWLHWVLCFRVSHETVVKMSARLGVSSKGLTDQAPPSMEFSRQEYWSGLPFPSPGDLPDPGIEPRSPALWALYRLSHQGMLTNFWFLKMLSLGKAISFKP